MDNYLTWQDHVQYVNIKLSKTNGISSKLRHYLPKKILRTLFYSFFQPHIEYCINIWTCADKTTLQPIEISMKKTIRTLSFAKRDDYAAPLFKELKIINFPKLYCQTFTFSLSFIHCPHIQLYCFSSSADVV